MGPDEGRPAAEQAFPALTEENRTMPFRAPIKTAGALRAGLFATAAFVGVGCEAQTTEAAAPQATAAAEPAAKKPPKVCAGCVGEKRLGQTVTVEAKVVQQCPARGCWFKAEDDEGSVMVDLSKHKLELEEDRVGQRAKVTGKVVKKGSKYWLEAKKVEFTAAGKETPAAETR